MDLNSNSGPALLWALRLAREHGGAAAALAAAGISMPEPEQLQGMPDDIEGLLGRPATDPSVSGALALGLLAGRVAHDRARERRLQDPTSFVMDQDLVVQAAAGQSILRLPWFEDDLFVGRQLPDIFEMPSVVRKLCVENYSAALKGERGRFDFTSYGHAYTVDAVPVRSDGDGSVEAILAIAIPARAFASAALGYERTAERLERSAELSEQRAERYRLAGVADQKVVELHAARKAREGAERARAIAQHLRARDACPQADPPSITSRQAEILTLASHGLTSGEISEQLNVSFTTVKSHFDNIYARLGVSDRAAAVATALRHGLIE
jgi:DNA-binding NarL/FixJ family response regulator